jgi:hypothetical protein
MRIIAVNGEPIENKKKTARRIAQFNLKQKLFETIRNFEKDNKLSFEPYEVDMVLLQIIHADHENYLTAKYGKDLL